jgi:hypothetical protein
MLANLDKARTHTLLEDTTQADGQREESSIVRCLQLL